MGVAIRPFFSVVMKRKKISDAVKRKLWASSGGYCCNPSCHRELFPLFEDGSIKCIDELAHIIGQQEKGPRGKNKLPLSQRDEFDNLIVLCPSCHTIVDKNPQTFTVEILKKWKKEHGDTIKNLMSVPSFQSRKDARNALLPLLEENRAIFDMYGPNSKNAAEKQLDTESMWYHLSIQKIIPNNRRIESILCNNQHLMTDKEKSIYNLFKLHREGFEYNKISGDVNPTVPRFPNELNTVFI